MRGLGPEMSDQSVLLRQLRNASVSKIAWLLAGSIPAAFVIYLFVLIVYVAPEQDDCCWYVQYESRGFIHSILASYFGFQGRVFLFVTVQVPSAIAQKTGIGILPSYWITLAISMIAFVGGCAFAIFRAWPGLPAPVAFFMVVSFVSAILGATSDLHDLLYWVAALVGYVPPGVISMIILGECVRALDEEKRFVGWGMRHGAWRVSRGYMQRVYRSLARRYRGRLVCRARQRPSSTSMADAQSRRRH